MSLKKSLLAFAMIALAMTAFASSAMATTGFLRNVNDNSKIPAGHELHFVGWMRLLESPGNQIDCQANFTVKAETEGGATGHVTQQAVPNLSFCEAKGARKGCVVTEHQSRKLPWLFTTTTTNFSVAGMEINDKYKSCPIFAPLTESTLRFLELNLTPLKEGTTPIWGTEGHLGEKANPGEPIAGVRSEGVAEQELKPGGVGTTVIYAGEFELTSADRSKWKITQF
jgi:hypothetical protein